MREGRTDPQQLLRRPAASKLTLPGRAERRRSEVYEAAVDETDHVTFVAGADAKTNYARRPEVGIDAFRAGIRAMVLGG